MKSIMGKSHLKLPALENGAKDIGKHIANLRKKKGYTQIELAKKIGIIQVLISDYENNKLRLNFEMIIRFATALEITTDELLGLQQSDIPSTKDKNLWKRLKKVELLPNSDRKSLLNVLDGLLSKNQLI